MSSDAAHVFEPRPAVAFAFLEHRDFLAHDLRRRRRAERGGHEYSLASEAAHPTLRIADADGEVVRELGVSGAPGVHRVAWDLRLAPLPVPVRPKTEGVDPANPRPAESTHARIPGDFAGGGDPTGGEAGAAPVPPHGPVLRPGPSQMTLGAGGADSCATLTVVPNPRAGASHDDLRAGDDHEDVRRTEHVDSGCLPRARPPRAVPAIVPALAAVKGAPDNLKKYPETPKLTRDPRRG